MNSDTGKIYTDPEEIRQAIKRGEPLEPIGPGVAEHDKRGVPCYHEGRHLTRALRRQIAREARRK